MALIWLTVKGYRLRHRNWRGAGGELDLVMSRAGTIAFVEVKARRSTDFGGAVAAVDRHKQRVLGRTAAAYLTRFDLWDRRAIRFDIVTIERLRGFPWWRLCHLGDAFRPDIGRAT